MGKWERVGNRLGIGWERRYLLARHEDLISFWQKHT